MATQRVRLSLTPRLPQAPASPDGVHDWITKSLLPQLAQELKELRRASRNVTILNMGAYYITGVALPGVANTEFTITHNLNRVPQHYMTALDQAGQIYDSRRANWTATQMFLKSTTANGNLTILVL